MQLWGRLSPQFGNFDYVRSSPDDGGTTKVFMPERTKYAGQIAGPRAKVARPEFRLFTQ